MKELNVFIIDDHPIICDAYKEAFKKITHEDEEKYKFNFSTANTCDQAIEGIKNYKQVRKSLDLVFLDMELPPSKDEKVLSGEDIALQIDQYHPNAKIIVCTSLIDNFRIHNILKNVNPDGFFIKCDISPQNLVFFIKQAIRQQCTNRQQTKYKSLNML